MSIAYQGSEQKCKQLLLAGNPISTASTGRRHVVDSFSWQGTKRRQLPPAEHTRSTASPGRKQNVVTSFSRKLSADSFSGQKQSIDSVP